MDFEIGTIEAEISAMWDDPPHKKIDWVRFEATLTRLLQIAAVDGIDSRDCLRLIDELQAATTRRGHALPPGYAKA